MTPNNSILLLKQRNSDDAALSASKVIQKIMDKSCLLGKSNMEHLPRFDRKDLKLGSFLGRGAYNDVHVISHINLTETDETDSESTSSYDCSDLSCSSNPSNVTTNIVKTLNTSIENGKFEDRIFMAKNCRKHENGNCRYVLKELRRDIVFKRKKFRHGAEDLVTEAHLLSSLDHPNIIRIRGISSAGIEGFRSSNETGFFLIMDRLYDTLKTRLDTWKKADRKFKLIKTVLDHKGTKRKAMLAHRLKVACQLASAMSYMHSKNVIYRDIKPDNIAFDEYGNVKLFDFGLAKELHLNEMLPDGTYKLAGMTGSIRYMAPEVARRETYNLLADVYSFTILLWEIGSLQKPFDDYDSRMHFKYVTHAGVRPQINKSWPSSIKSLMEQCWSENINERLNFDEIVNILKKEISNLCVEEKMQIYAQQQYFSSQPALAA